MPHVLRRAAQRIVLVQPPHRAPGRAQRLLHRMAAERLAVDRKQHQQLEDSGALLEGDAVVHVGFREGELRVEEDRARDRLVLHPDGHRRPIDAAAEGVATTRDVDDGEPALLDEAGQET